MRKLVCLLMATMLLVGLCFALASCGECKHGEYAAEYETVDPTCTTDGKYVYTCLKCNEKVDVAPAADDTVMLMTGHTANSGEVTTAPTCTEKGAKTFKCKICNADMPEKTEEVAALGHEVDEDEFSNDGTSHWNVCSREECGAKVNTEDHDMYFGQHSDTECAEVCDICLYVDEDSKVAHAFDEGKVTKDATCSAVGIKTFTCENCGYEKDEDVPVISHTYDETKYVTDGTDHWYACSVCEAKKADSIGACVYGEPEVTQPVAGSCAPGAKVSTCETCGGEKVESLPSDVPHALANATLDGDSVKYTCTKCQAIYTVKGVTGLTDFETASSSDTHHFTTGTEWSTEVVTGTDGNSYASAKVASVPEQHANYSLQGPFTSLSSLRQFIVDFDIMLNDKGLCGAMDLKPKDSTNAWPGTILTIKQDGSFASANGTSFGAAGTVNGTTWTHVTILCDLDTGKMTYYINGVLVKEVKEEISDKHKGITLLYLNFIIPPQGIAPTEDNIGCGVYLDNMSLATGEGAGVSLEVGTAAE